MAVNSFSNNFSRIGKAYRDGYKRGGRKAADLLAERWKGRVHVVTGEYRDSIHVEEQGDKTFLVTADAPHAIYEEYGTRYRPGHPAYTPAVEETQADYLDTIAGELPR